MWGIQQHRQNCDRLFEEDKLFGAKIVYQVDKIFQEFCQTLSEYSTDQDSIQAARRRLWDFMEDEIDDLLKDIRKERITQFILPPALQQTDSGPSPLLTPTPICGGGGWKPKPTRQGESPRR
jgi:hypothetical protein